MDKRQFLFTSYLEKLKYRVTQEIILRLLSDPDNLVLSFTNTLDYFNIQHIAANVPKTALDQLPKYFIAQVSNGKTEHIVLASKETNKTIKIQLAEDKTVTLNENEFLNDWTGFIIAIEENKVISKTSSFRENITYNGLLVCALILLLYVFNATKSVLLSSYFALSLTGLGLSYLIIMEKIGQQTFASKFCKISTTTSCDNVLNSITAKVLKNIDLSDIVVVYFTFISVAFLLEPTSILLSIFSLLSLPVILYSLYQQYFNIKKWCPLCLGVASILALQFLTLLPFYKVRMFHNIDILLFSSVLGIIILCWLSIEQLLVLEQKNNTLEIENLSFRRNHKLFIPYYNSLNQIDTEDNNIPQIVLGTKNSLLKLIIVINPLCKSCIEAHKTYMNILKNYNDNIQIGFRFLVPNQNRTDNETIISVRLIQLYFENETEVFLEAFNDWYRKLNVKKWIGKWGKCEDIKYNQILSLQINWCLKQEIDSAPAILINNRLFPENYSFSDIEPFIMPILEQKANKKEDETNTIHA